MTNRLSAVNVALNGAAGTPKDESRQHEGDGAEAERQSEAIGLRGKYRVPKCLLADVQIPGLICFSNSFERIEHHDGPASELA